MPGACSHALAYLLRRGDPEKLRLCLGGDLHNFTKVHVLKVDSAI